MKKRLFFAAMSAVLMMTACGSGDESRKTDGSVKEAVSSSEAEGDSSVKSEGEPVSESETSAEESGASSGAEDGFGAVDNGDGTYTCTAYGDISVDLKADIDDYVIENKYGTKVFKIKDYAVKTGWYPDLMFPDNATAGAPQSYGYPFTEERDEYKNILGSFTQLSCWTYYGDDYIGQVRHGEVISGREPEGPQLRQISLSVGSRSKTGMTYNKIESSVGNTLDLYIGRHPEDAVYYVSWWKDNGSISSFYASRDDVILIAYILSNPRTDGDPFAGTGFEKFKLGLDHKEFPWGTDYTFP